MNNRKIRIAFCRSRKGFRNWVIRKWTGSDIVHAEIVLPDGSFIGISPEDTGRVRRTLFSHRGEGRRLGICRDRSK